MLRLSLFCFFFYCSTLLINGATASLSTSETMSSLANVNYYSVAVSTTWTEPLYWSSPCSSQTPVSFGTCASKGQGTLTEPYCLGGQEVVPFGIVFANTVYYKGTIPNFSTCTGSFVLSLEVGYGIKEVKAEIGLITKTLYATSWPTSGVMPISMCCSEIRAMAGLTWDGTFYVTVTTLGASQMNLLLPANPTRLPVTSYRELVPVNVTCGTTTVTCKSSGCPINVEPTMDPIFSFWTSTLINYIGNLPIVRLPATENTMTTLLWKTKIVPGSKVGSGLFGLGNQIVTDDMFNSASCKITYNNLVNANGNAINLQSTASEAYPNTCDTENYLPFYESLNQVSTFLEMAATSSQEAGQIYAYLDLAASISSSIAWNNCLDSAYSFLNENTSNFVERNNECFVVDSDPAWATDPCCNTKLQMTQCCRYRDFTFSATAYSLDDDFKASQLPEQCKVPDCLVQPLKNLEAISGFNSKKECLEDRRKAETEPSFLANPFTQCVGRAFGIRCFYDNVCKSIDPSSQCDPAVQQCIIPCTTQADCYNGKCVSGRCEGLSTDITVQHTAVMECSLAKIDPYLSVLVKNEIEKSGTGSTMVQKFVSLVSENSCSTALGVPIDRGDLTEAECKSYPGFCKVLGGIINTTFGFGSDMTGKIQDITPEFCSRTVLYQDKRTTGTPGLCAYQTTNFIVVPLSRPNVCEIRTTDTNFAFVDFAEVFCKLVLGGDTWVGQDIVGWRGYSSCVKMAADTESKCVGAESQICLGTQYKGVPCHSYCWANNIAAEVDCVTPVGGPTRTWYWRPGLVGIAGVCVVESGGYEACPFPQFIWIAGRNWLPERFNSPETCPTKMCFGYWDGSGPKLTTPLDQCIKYSCNTCKNGNEPQCASEAACKSVKACDNAVGCLLPNFIASLMGYSVPCVWDPKNCITVTDKPACLRNALTGGTWYDFGQFPTEAACINDQQICNDGTAVDGSYRNKENLARGYNYRNQTECEACGGHMEKWWNWAPSEWISNNIIIGPSWLTNTIEPAFWKPNLSSRKFEEVLSKARVRRLTSILAAELSCLYGIESDLLVYIACSCAEGKNVSGECFDTLTQVDGSPISILSVCEGIPVSKSIYDVTISTNNFVIVDRPDDALPCITLDLDIVPSEQFTYQALGLTSSLALVTETERAKLSSTYVYNENDVVVGELVGNGYGFTFSTEYDFTGLNLCINLPSEEEVDWSLRAPLFSWDIAVANSSDFKFVPLGLNLELSETQACTQLESVDGLIYFPIGLYENWEESTITKTWTSEEKGLMIFCIVTFLILFIWVTWSFFMRIMFNKLSKFPRPELCLLSLMVLSGLGAAYQIGTYVGAYQGGNLSPLFTDLPQLCLLTCIVITCATWRLIVNKGKMSNKQKETIWEKMIPFLFLLSLYAIFVALMIASATADNSKEFTCATTQDEKDAMTTSEQISTSYKAIFAFYTFVIALAFCYSGVKVIHMLSSAEAEQFKDVVIKSSIATVIATLALFITVAISLYSVNNTLENTTKLAFTITVLILPGYALAYLFSFKSEFTSKLVDFTKSFKTKTTKSEHGSDTKKSSKTKTTNTPSSADSNKR